MSCFPKPISLRPFDSQYKQHFRGRVFGLKYSNLLLGEYSAFFSSVSLRQVFHRASEMRAHYCLLCTCWSSPSPLSGSPCPSCPHSQTAPGEKSSLHSCSRASRGHSSVSGRPKASVRSVWNSCSFHSAASARGTGTALAGFGVSIQIRSTNGC